MLAGPRPEDPDALACAEALLGNLAAQMGSLGLGPLMNCLKLMAFAPVQEIGSPSSKLKMCFKASHRDFA